MPSIVPEGATRGWIIPIGGAENKENDRHILERFVDVAKKAKLMWLNSPNNPTSVIMSKDYFKRVV